MATAQNAKLNQAEIVPIDFHGQAALRLSLRNGATAVVSLLGGQVLSWQPPSGKEWLFLSTAADFSGATAIRGGVPVCFPQFANYGDLPKHGLLRTRHWEVRSQRCGKDFAMLVLGIESDDDSLNYWPYPFNVEVAIGLEAGRLDIELEVNNTGDEAFSFSTALHTYLRVAEAEEAAVQGLQNLAYVDRLAADTLNLERSTLVQIDDEVDRIYQKPPQTLLVHDSGRDLAVRLENFADVVLWNPWEDKCAELPDMTAKDFRRMLCLEPANITTPITLPAGESWWGRQTLADVAYSDD